MMWPVAGLLLNQPKRQQARWPLGKLAVRPSVSLLPIRLGTVKRSRGGPLEICQPETSRKPTVPCIAVSVRVIYLDYAAQGQRRLLNNKTRCQLRGARDSLCSESFVCVTSERLSLGFPFPFRRFRVQQHIRFQRGHSSPRCL